MKRTLAALLALSVLLNVALAAVLLYFVLQGCAEVADGQLGVLTRDLQVGEFFGLRGPIHTSERIGGQGPATGADWFEPNRFGLVITSDDEGLVNFSSELLLSGCPRHHALTSRST